MRWGRRQGTIEGDVLLKQCCCVVMCTRTIFAQCKYFSIIHIKIHKLHMGICLPIRINHGSHRQDM